MALARLSKVASVMKLSGPLLKVQKHSPTIMFAGGVAGVLATVVLASRATLKLNDVLEQHEENVQKAKVALDVATEENPYDQSDYKTDMAKIYGKTIYDIVKLYAPAFAIGAISILSLTGSHIVLTRRNLSAIAAYTAMEKSFREYRERVVSKYGVDADTELRYAMEEHEIVEEGENGPETKTVLRPTPAGANGYARMFDETTSTSWQRAMGYNQNTVANVTMWANEKLRAQGYLFLNDLWEMLGMERTPEGQLVGWIYDEKKRHPKAKGYVDLGLFEAGHRESGDRFVNHFERSVLLDPNVDPGTVYQYI